VSDESEKTKDEKTRCYEYIAHQINREDGLVNFRLTWVLTLNGLLFATLGFLGGKQNLDPAILAFFSWALPFTGIVVSVAGVLGVVAAQMQIKYLTRWHKDLKDSRWPRPYGDEKHAFFFGTLPSFAPPGILIFVWLGLLLT
jgi:hypothetical protein